MRPDLGREARLMAAAIMTLTRCPVPGPERALPADWLARASKYFPLVGAAVGGLSGLVLAGAAVLWPAPIPALLAVTAALLATGALHEDGLADTADSLGGRTPAARLAIMKDPRIGPFGMLALAVTVALKVAALSCLPVPVAAAALVAGGAVSRFLVLPVMARASYAGDRTLAKFDHGIEGPRSAEVAVGAAMAIVPVLFLDLPRGLAALACAAAVAALASMRICRALGGYTGDVLGAVVVLSETAFLLGAAAAWR